MISRWRQLQLNTHTPPTTQHTRCETPFINTFGDLPSWIDPSVMIRLVTQNFQDIKHNDNDDKLQSGIFNVVALQAGITCLTETNVEWHNFSCRQGYKDAVTKLYSASRHRFSSSPETSSTPHKRGGTVTSATGRTHRVHFAGQDSTGGGRWSYFTIIGKDNNLLVITCYRVFPRPPPYNIISSYYQQSRVV
jgi:hypothetical protein